MQEFKFYINGIEIEEPRNWEDIKFSVSRDAIYFGLERKASLKSIEVFGIGADLLKQDFANNGFNAQSTFFVERLNYDFNKYEMYSNNVVDFQSYKIGHNVEDEGIVFVDVLDNSVYAKISNREKNELIVGNLETLEGESTSIISRATEDVLFKSRGTILEGFFEYVNPDTTTDVTQPLYVNDYIRPIASLSNGTISFIDSTTLSTINPADLNGSGAGYNALNLENIHINESANNEDMTCAIDFALQWGLVGTTGDVLKINLYSVEYNGTNFSNLALVHSTQETLTENYGSIFGSGATLVVKDDFTFTKVSNKLYFFAFVGDAANNNLDILYNIAGTTLNNKMTFYINHPTIGQDSTHNTVFIHNAMLSCLEQITDTPLVLYSEVLGKPSDGYDEYGEFSKIVVTNGLFLRNAVNSDGSDIELVLSFRNLYNTITNLFGLSMWYDKNDGLIHIEKRSESFNGSEVEITLENIEQTIANEFLYTSIKVGNKNVKYENINGANEFNTTLEFNTPLNVKSKSLNLVTQYNTDYLGVDLARRIQFENEKKEDTKYDEKVFLVEVDLIDDIWQTKMGIDYDIVADIPLPDNAGNLLFSPKRSLLRNSDLIKASFHNLSGSEISFSKATNLAALTSRKGTSWDIIVERDNVVESDMNSLFKPIYWSGEIPKRDLYKLFLSQDTIFTFKLNGKTIKGYLWKGEIDKDVAKIKILEKW